MNFADFSRFAEWLLCNFQVEFLGISTLAAMIPRQIEKHFKWVTLNFPIVIVLGPRQSGKTAFVRDMFSKHAYINLEDESYFKLAKENPADFFKQHPTPIILDEAQRLPKLLSMIKILTNNHGFELFILHENSMQLIEIKTARTYDFSLAKNIRKISEKTNEIKSASVIYAGESLVAEGIEFRNFKYLTPS